jgi:hypothetical protein
MVYSGPTFLLSYLLSSLPITALTTCAAALILFRSALRTYIWSTQAPSSSTAIPPLLPPHHSAHHLCCRSQTIQVSIKNIYTVYSGPFLLSYLLSSLLITAINHLCCRSHTLQVCIKNIYTVYLGPFLLSYLLSSLLITALTTCAAALIIFRSV